METEDRGPGWRIILMSIFCHVCVAIDRCPQFTFVYSIEYFLQCFGNAFIRWQFVIGQKEKRIYKFYILLTVHRVMILGKGQT